MSSFLRTIQRTMRMDDSNSKLGPIPVSARKDRSGKSVHFAGRGSKMGVTNPKDPCTHPAHRKAPKPWRAASKIEAKPKVLPNLGQPLPTPVDPTLHKRKMAAKQWKRDQVQPALRKPDRVQRLLGVMSTHTRAREIAKNRARGCKPYVAPAPVEPVVAEKPKRVRKPKAKVAE